MSSKISDVVMPSGEDDSKFRGLVNNQVGNTQQTWLASRWTSLGSSPWAYAISFALWTFFAIFSAAGSYIYSTVAGGTTPAWTLLLTWNFSDAYTWALFTPAIHSLSGRYSVSPRHWKAAAVFHVPVALLVAGLGALLTAFWIYLLPWSRVHPFAPFRVEVVALFWGNIPRYCLVAALSQAATFRQQLRDRLLRSSQLETQLANAQLDALRRQIEPHFLFNVLNSIATLARTDRPSAERMTLQLADLLRMSLQNTGQHEVPLAQELEVLDRYLLIQQTRFSDRLRVYFDIEPALMNVAVPHLVLQPLVENAIRHGISQRSASGRIEVKATRWGEKLLLQVVDDGAGLKREFGDTSGQGVGLRNTRARLQQLYGVDFEFCCRNLPTGGCEARILFPCREMMVTPTKVTDQPCAYVH